MTQEMKAAEPKRVKILQTEYVKRNDLVVWTIQILSDMKVIRMAWLGNDLAIALGIKGKIEPYLMTKFCQDMVGKEINLVIDAVIKEPPTFSKDMDMKAIKDLHDELDKYPYYEVVDAMMNGAENKQ